LGRFPALNAVDGSDVYTVSADNLHMLFYPGLSHKISCLIEDKADTSVLFMVLSGRREANDVKAVAY
jgi:hypothetical protein